MDHFFKPLIMTSDAANILGVNRNIFAQWVSLTMPRWEGEEAPRLTPVEVFCFAAAVRIKANNFLLGERSLVYCLRELPEIFGAILQGDKSRARLKLVEPATGRLMTVDLGRIIADVAPKLDLPATRTPRRARRQTSRAGQTNQLSGQNGRCRGLANA